MSETPTLEEARELLATVLRDPLEIHDAEADRFDSHVCEWFRLLIKEFPLWSWQPWAYANLHQSDLPTTYPVDQLIASVLRDEGLTQAEDLDPLAASLDRRRFGIAGGDGYAGYWVHSREDGSVRLLPAPPQFRYARDLTDWEPDSEYTIGGYLSPYEDIGRELVSLIEAREQARASGNKDALLSARARLSGFLKRITVKAKSGRPPEGPGEEIIGPLAEEGRRLLELCWEALPDSPSDGTRQVLREHGAGEEEVDLWATRLALPILSKPEIQGLLAQVTCAPRSKPMRRPTPRRFAIWVLAHRLDLLASTIARRAAGGSGGAYEEFQDVTTDDPLRPFLPGFPSNGQ